MDETKTTSHLYLSKGRILLVSNNLNNDSHAHHSLQITLSLEDKAYVIKHLGGHDFSQCSLIKPSYKHQIELADTWRLLILLDAEAAESRQIEQRYLQQKNIATPSQSDIDYCKQRIEKFTLSVQVIEEAEAAIDDIVRRFSGNSPELPNIDSRINHVIELIHRAEGRHISSDTLAEHIGLSSGRLSHLFKAVVGIPIKRYILWYKLSQTVFKVANGMSPTKAAYDSGFADSAHYSRTFRKMFGMTPSKILRQSDSVTVITDM